MVLKLQDTKIAWVRLNIPVELHSRVKMFQNAYNAKHDEKITLVQAYHILVLYALNDADIQNPNIDKFQNI